MLITPKTYDNPSFVIGPVNNNRTAWRPVNLPAILIVPFVSSLRTARGNITRVRVYVEDVPQSAIVAGHDHVGQRFPDRLLYEQSISDSELVRKQIDVSIRQMYVGNTDVETDIATAAVGTGIVEYQFDTFEYVTASGIRFRLPYLPDAAYYDLSDVFVETDGLPHGHYNLVYEASYHPRLMSVPDRRELSCILSGTAVTKTKFHINHPGEVLAEMVRMTPQIALGTDPKPVNANIGFYRIFADILNDIYDEYGLLRSLSWATAAPYEILPHLAAMLGWDLPYFPNSKDNLRRATLVTIDQLQRLKGSKRALQDIFNLFGFEIRLTPIWWSTDGKSLIRPDEGGGVTTVTSTTTEPMLFGYDDPGFGGLSVPLLYRPTGDVEVNSIEVEVGSDAEAFVAGMTEPTPDTLAAVTALDGFIGFSRCTFDSLGQAILDVDAADNPPIINSGLKWDARQNTINVIFNGYKDFNETALYAFATYDKQEYEVSEELQYLRSNRFVLQILKPDGTEIPSDLMEFMIDFVYKIKAFHSLLEVIKINITIHDVYLVTDFCIGGDIQQRFNTDAGKLQVPPAILPRSELDGDCENVSPELLGFKAADLRFRSDMLAGLATEYLAWIALNGRVPDEGSHLVPHLDGGTEREYAQFGQNRTPPGTLENANGQVMSPDMVANSEDRGEAFPGDLFPKSSHNDTSRYGSYTYDVDQTSLINSDVGDYCYKGRVSEELLTQLRNINDERYFVQSRPHGSGVYWTYPVPTKVYGKGVARAGRSRTSKTTFTANATTPNEVHKSVLRAGLTQPMGEKLSLQNTSYLGQLLRAYDTPTPNSLHYSDRNYADLRQSQELALRRSSLDVAQAYQHFPGCRFATQNRLLEDFSHPEWMAKPWDYRPSNACGTFPCGGEFTYLNFRMETNTDGDDVLVYDSEPFTALGNGLVPDISSNGEHDLSVTSFTEEEVVHSVYSGYEDRDWVTFDGVLRVEPDIIATVSNSLFSSARPSGTSVIDYIDGYPAEVGFFAVTDDTLSDVLTEDVRLGLGMPEAFDGSPIAFRNISGILENTGRRLSESLRLTCMAETFSHDIPVLEYIENDAVEMDNWVSLSEEVCSTYVNDGSLGSNLMTLDFVPSVKMVYRTIVNPPVDVAIGSSEISWTAADNVAGYQIQYSLDNVTWAFLNTFLTETSCTHNGAGYFRVRSMKYNKYSEWVYS